MKRVTAVFAVIALVSMIASAQTPTPAPAGLVFTTSAEATALHFNGLWTAANHTTESLDLIDWGVNKGNSLSIEGHQLVAPSAGFAAYLGGVKYQPDIATLMSKTNIPADSFTVFAQTALGAAPQPNSAPSKITFLVGGGAQYRATTNLTWTPLDMRFGRMGSQSFLEMSTGLLYYFNPQAARSTAAVRFLAKRAKLARMKAEASAQ
jgi:hypothetical protein